MTLKTIPVTKKFLLKSKWSYVAVGIVSFLLISGFGLTSVYERFEYSLYDLRFKIKPAPQVWNKLVLLDIDDSSIVNVGEFPWPRNYYARGIDVLKGIGVRNFLFDIQFMDKSPRFIDSEAMEKLRTKIASRAPVSLSDAEATAIDNDAVLAKGIKSFAGTALPYSFENQVLFEDDGSPASRARIESLKLFMKKATIPVPKGREKEFAQCVDPAKKSVHPPIAPLVEAGNIFGFVDSDPELDGYIRRIRLVRVFEGRIYFHMALVSLAELSGVPRDQIIIEPGNRIVLKNALNPATLVRGDISIPVDQNCALFINWAGEYEKTFNHLSFYAVLEYDLVKDSIHEWLNETEKDSGSGERSALIEKRMLLRQRLSAEKDDARRRETAASLAGVVKTIAVIEDSYLKSLEAVRDQLANEVKNDPSKKQELADAENQIVAVKVVRGVDALRDSICITGYTANASQDVGATPLSPQYYLVGTYPNIINTIVQKGFVHKVPHAVELIIMFVFALGIGAVVQKQSAKASILISVSAFAASNAAVMLLFAFAGIWVTQLGTSLSLAIPSVAIIGVRFLSEESQKKFIKDTFSKYLAKQVVDELIKDPERIKLGGEEQEITIFFSDIRSFTSLSEKMTPGDLVGFLNEYLSDMTDIILSNRGTVDKFIGDAIMAFYGAPYHYDDHALAACRAAIEMQRRLTVMREQWRKHGHSEIYSRFGINTGIAVVGNMGSRERISYTAMGDSVNLASRLEGANKYYGTFSMISETTYSAVKNDVEVRYLDKIKVVGKEQPINVYELVSEKGNLTKAQKELFEIYTSGIELFTDREWEKARRVFSQAMKLHKDDGPSKTYHDRCNEFINKPPSKKWDGVYTMKSK